MSRDKGIQTSGREEEIMISSCSYAGLRADSLPKPDPQREAMDEMAGMLVTDGLAPMAWR